MRTTLGAQLSSSALAAIAVLLAWSTPALAQESVCGPLTSSYGPFDYRTQKKPLKVVEQYHFNANVENLVSGMTGSLEGDLDYVLATSPNHHRALMALARLSERPTFRPDRLRWRTPECYFDRAIRFAPNDPVVYLMFAMFLSKQGKSDQAVRQLKQAETVTEFPLTHYNIGLVYFEMGRYEDALRQAQRALAGGYTRTDLMEKLKAVGKWVDTGPATAAPDAAASKPTS